MKEVQQTIEWDDEKVARLWNNYARNGVPYFTQTNGAYVASVIRHYLPGNARKLLDFGSGPGFLFAHLKNALGSRLEYHALDFSEDSITALNKRHPGDPQIKAARRTESLPSDYEPDSFDIVVSCEVVEHLKDEYLDSTLIEIYRLLEPGGLVFITTPNDEYLPDSFIYCPNCDTTFHEWQHVRSWNQDTLRSTMESYGFQTIACQGTYFARLVSRIKWRILTTLTSKRMPNLYYVGRKPV
jgi:2-polyprenyl-3-methyl-5-hydroxy-6-metoxy-1,4-benzoquinol methylase